MSISTRRAGSGDLTALSALFDRYRRFYGEPSDLGLARRFLSERMERGESVVLLAEDETGAPVGFVQLYPGFSSVRASRVLVLNDLFVAEEARGRGAGAALMDAAETEGRDAGAVSLCLSTALDNVAAQRLYEGRGWVRDEKFCVYEKALKGADAYAAAGASSFQDGVGRPFERRNSAL